jgi:hypothetical protein
MQHYYTIVKFTGEDPVHPIMEPDELEGLDEDEEDDEEDLDGPDEEDEDD